MNRAPSYFSFSLTLISRQPHKIEIWFKKHSLTHILPYWNYSFLLLRIIQFRWLSRESARKRSGCRAISYLHFLSTLETYISAIAKDRNMLQKAFFRSHSALLELLYFISCNSTVLMIKPRERAKAWRIWRQMISRYKTVPSKQNKLSNWNNQTETISWNLYPCQL